MKLKSQRLGWALLLLWILGTSLLLFRFGQSDYGEFDPERQLQQYPKQLAALLHLTDAAVDETVLVHILDASCRCSVLAQAHISQLQSLFQTKVKLRQLQRSVADLQQAGITVPATPMVIVLRDKQLVYSGPYASGPACRSEDSLLDAILLQRLNTPAAWLNSETAACRCANVATLPFG